MSIECYNTLCNFHNKTEPFCEETECHCINGNPNEPCWIYAHTLPPVLRKDVACYTCKTAHKCDMVWIDQNRDQCMIELVIQLEEEYETRKRKTC